MKKFILYLIVILVSINFTYAACNPDWLDSRIVVSYNLSETALDYEDTSPNGLDLNNGTAPTRTSESWGFGQRFENSNSEYLDTSASSKFELTNFTIGHFIIPRTNTPDHHGLWATAFNSGGLKGAMEQINQSVAMEPENPDYRFHKALIASDSGDASGALEELDYILDKQSEFPAREEAEQLKKKLGN